MDDASVVGDAGDRGRGWWLGGLVLALMGGALGVLYVAAAEAVDGDATPSIARSAPAGDEPTTAAIAASTFDPGVAHDDSWGALGP